MARYVIDAPTLLHIVAVDVEVSPDHHLVAPNLIRSQALAVLLGAVRHGDITEDIALHRVTKLQADALVTIDGALAAAAALKVSVAPVTALSVDS